MYLVGRWRGLCLFAGALVCAPVLPAQVSEKPTATVAGDGSGQYKTVQEAVNSAPAQGLVIRIAPGHYREKLVIAGNGIELRGTGAKPQDVVLTYDDSAGSVGGTGKSGSVSVSGDDFVAENLTMENSWERNHARTEQGSQAVALLITGDREVLRNVRLLGYQDTLYAASKTCHAPADAAGGPCRASRQLFADCYIEGHVDFIFGDAKAAFDHCELHAMANPTVMFTAQSKLFPAEDSGYLFRDCTITAAPGAGKLVLGRPWRAYSTVVFINTKLSGAKLAPEGWSEWDGRLATSSYAEFNTGPGDDTSRRVSGSRQLTAAEAAGYTVRSWVAGTDNWNPESVR